MDPVERFYLKLIKEGDCLLYPTIANNGYGKLQVGKRYISAHRYAWEIKHGKIKNGLWVLHKCLNKNCANVKHLYLGTNRENMYDMYAQTRGRSKMTPEMVREVRRRYKREKITGIALARELNVPHSAVYNAKSGKTFKWLP